MARTSTRPIVAVGLVAALLVYVGCSGEPGTKLGAPPTVKPTPAPDSQKKSADGSKLFANWSQPAGVLLISGEQNGYLEPCGCTKGQQGGLIRKYDLSERLTARKWPLALVDLGSLVKDPAAARGGSEESKLKFVTALKALSAMNYSALALSTDDLKVGVGEALGQFLNMGEKPRIVVANVEAPGFESVIKPSLRTSAGNVKIGVTAVLDPDKMKALADPEKDSLLKTKPIAEVLPGVLTDLEKDTEIQVLMVQGPPELAKTLATAHPGFDVVVATSEYDDPEEKPESLNEGRTMLVNVGRRGKFVGVVGFFPETKEQMRYQRVPLDSQFDGPAEAMKRIVEVDFREMLKAQHIVENFPRHGYVNGAPGATFVGAEACKDCHPKTYEKWEGTRHADGFQSLLDDKRPNLIYDAECIACHTTGFEYNSGYVSQAATPQLLAVQCENCHGPASKHVEQPKDLELRKRLALTDEQVDKTRLCLRCHDEDNSPHFKFEKYLKEIAHKELDRYDNPKVLQGVAPKTPAATK